MSYAWQKFMQATSSLISPSPIDVRLSEASFILQTLSTSGEVSVPKDMEPMYFSIIDRLANREALSLDEQDALCEDIFSCFKKLHRGDSLADGEPVDC